MMNYHEKVLQHAFANSVDVLKLTEYLCEKVSADKIPGEFCEAGTAYGAHGIMMKNKNWDNRKIILFDSFQGISVHGPEDVDWVKEHGPSIANPRESGGITVAKLEDVKETMGKYVPNMDNIEFRPGWFIDTFPKIPVEEKYAVLRLDCDLYDPYKLCLEYLYPRLSMGGWLIIDDFNLAGCRQALEEFGFPMDKFIILHTTNNAYIQKGNFFLHKPKNN